MAKKCCARILLVSATVLITVFWSNSNGKADDNAFAEHAILRLNNPNLRLTGPKNNALGAIEVDPAQGPSPWRLLQWHTPPQMVLRPQIPNGSYLDPFSSHLGRATYSQITKSSRLAIFSTKTGSIFELGSTHGKSTAGGGQNLFIEIQVPEKKPVTMDSMINLRAAVPYLEMVAATDDANAAQVFVGMVFNPLNPRFSKRSLFIQVVFADSRGGKILTPPAENPDGAIYASSNPEVGGAGVANYPLTRGRCALLGPGMKPVHINIFPYLNKAVARQYPWTNQAGQHSITTYPPELRDASQWTLNSIYVGTEVQGPKGNITVRFSNIAIKP